MRCALALAGLASLILLAPTSADAGGLPAPWMNYHQPFNSPYCYWYCHPWQIAGPTDIAYPYPQPVNPIGPPPFGPRGWYGQNPYAGHGPLWHRYVRSPRDFFMNDP
jgi:hypothetical protein